MNKEFKHIGQPRYAIIDSGIFGLRIVTGIVTGIRFTETSPQYEISFQKNTWWTSLITDKVEDIGKLLTLTTLEEVNKKHELKINYGSEE